MLKRGPVSSATLAGILAHATTIDSDYELSELLRQILSQQTLDDRNRAAFFRARRDDRQRLRAPPRAERRGRTAARPRHLEAALDAGREHRQRLREPGRSCRKSCKQSGVEGAVRAPFFKVVSTHGLRLRERPRAAGGRRRSPASATDTLRDVLQSSRGMSGYELSQLLQTVAAARSLTGDLRDAYVDAADRLSGYDQSQVLAALVKSERRR